MNSTAKRLEQNPGKKSFKEDNYAVSIISTIKSFTTQGNFWKLKANDFQKKQGKGNK